MPSLSGWDKRDKWHFMICPINVNAKSLILKDILAVGQMGQTGQAVFQLFIFSVICITIWQFSACGLLTPTFY
jgi:hypothetical protein